jgi:hypothetical protein
MAALSFSIGARTKPLSSSACASERLAVKRGSAKCSSAGHLFAMPQRVSAPEIRPILQTRLTSHSIVRVTVTSDPVRQRLCRDRRMNGVLGSMQDVGTHAEARRTTPSGSLPVLVKRHSAIRSFRAGATIMVLRVPRAFSVRKRNHWDRALSF